MASLRTKILIVLGVLTVVLTTVLYFVLESTILKGFSAIELDLVKQNVERVSNGLDSYFRFLTSKTGDWAKWDDTYEFVDDLNEEYIRENLVPEAFYTLDINFVVYFNQAGEMVYSYGLDRPTKTSVEADSEFLKQASEIHKAFQQDITRGHIVLPGKSPLLFVMYPILKSDGSGPPNGVVIFARYFDEEMLQLLTQNTIFPLELRKVDEPDLPEGFQYGLRELLKQDESSTLVFPEDYLSAAERDHKAHTIEGYLLIRDSFQRPAFLLKIGIPREIHDNAEFAVFSVLILIIFAGAVFMGTVYLLMEKLILRRLFQLRKQINSISQNNYEATRSVIISGSDEIFFLSWEIQNMLERLVIYQENFRKTTERYRGILQSQNEFIARFDDQGVLLFANDAYRQKFAQGKRRLIGQKFLLPVQEQDVVPFETTVSLLSQPPYRFSKEQRVLTQEGWRWILWEFYAVRDQEGKLLEIQHIGRDITKEKEVDTMKSEFISLASHQLRTPLTGIKWFTDLLLKDKAGALSAQQKEFVAQVAESNERMIKLVNDLLDISHIESGKKFIIQRSPTNIGAILQELVEQELALAKEKNITIVYDHYLFNSLSLLVDGEKIRQVFQNLLTNAVKYSTNDSKVEVTYLKEKESHVFSVKDQGVGIPHEQQSRVFEKFFRADNVLTLYTTGTGLGLYITKIIVERHGGSIGFHSEVNQGTAFYFSLPCKENPSQ